MGGGGSRPEDGTIYISYIGTVYTYIIYHRLALNNGIRHISASKSAQVAARQAQDSHEVESKQKRMSILAFQFALKEVTKHKLHHSKRVDTV